MGVNNVEAVGGATTPPILHRVQDIIKKQRPYSWIQMNTKEWINLRKYNSWNVENYPTEKFSDFIQNDLKVSADCLLKEFLKARLEHAK